MIRIEIELSSPTQAADGVTPALHAVTRALKDALAGTPTVVHRISAEEEDV